MKIGFYSIWNLNENKFIGDHLYSKYLCQNLIKSKEVESAEIYAPNKLPKEKLDFMIYLNGSPPVNEWAKKHILYFQNGYAKEEAIAKLEELKQFNFDLCIFVSEKLRDISEKMGNKSCLLTFGGETSVFYPREKDKNYEFDVSYVGNDLKGKERTIKYILPAVNFFFGLFGNWKYSKRDKLKHLFFFMPKYKRILKNNSRGYISNENISVLYSSSKINLSCTGEGFADFDSYTTRPLEILACKGFLITDDIPSLRKLLGGGAVYTLGGEDLKKKIDYYLNHEDERKKIAEMGYKKVIESESVFEKSKILIKYLKDLS